MDPYLEECQIFQMSGKAENSTYRCAYLTRSRALCGIRIFKLHHLKTDNISTRTEHGFLMYAFFKL